MNLKDKRVLVTGGSGFLGGQVMRQLSAVGFESVRSFRSHEYDLRDGACMKAMFEVCKPEVVIHLAAVCGGIEANRMRPGTFFYDNAMMGIQLIEACRQYKVKKVVVVGTVCGYPKHCPVPFKEEDLWNGYPEETNAPYGMAKKMLLVQLQAYRQQYGLNGIYLLPVNLYGPHDNFDLTTSHVIPALIRKMIEAKSTSADSVKVWGDGSASREFLYVDDCAQGIVKATLDYDKGDPVNLGTGTSIKIKDLVHLIAEQVGYKGKIKWDKSKPNGQPKRQLNVSKAKKFGFKAKTTFEEGIRKTIEWYQSLK